jgi:hypothetical protein
MQAFEGLRATIRPSCWGVHLFQCNTVGSAEVHTSVGSQRCHFLRRHCHDHALRSLCASPRYSHSPIEVDRCDASVFLLMYHHCRMHKRYFRGTRLASNIFLTQHRTGRSYVITDLCSIWEQVAECDCEVQQDDVRTVFLLWHVWTYLWDSVAECCSGL